MLQPTVRRTWAPLGQTPVHHSWDRHDRLSVISGISVSPQRRRLGLYFDIAEHNIDTDDFETFVQTVQRQLGRGLILVMDRWSVHRKAAKRLAARSRCRIEVEWLPPYAPELNPVEQIWKHSKYDDMPNFIPEDKFDLADEICQSIRQTRSDQALLRSFFEHAGLKL